MTQSGKSQRSSLVGHIDSRPAGEENESLRYLLFRLGRELYGCQLTQIREVIKVGVIKPVPYMVGYFKGVINLRGKIIGVIDLSEKLGLSGSAEQRLILIVENNHGFMGVIVDEVVSVEPVAKQDIEARVNIEAKIAPHFFDGIGKIRDRLAHLVRLADMVSEEEYRTLERSAA